MSKSWKRLFSLLLALVFLFSASTSAYASAVASEKATAEVVAAQQEAAKISLSKKALTLYKGKSSTLKVKGSVSDVTWKSSTPSVAKVSKTGKVTAVKKGSAVISATVDGKTYKCKVTVKNPELSKSKLTVQYGDTAKLELKGATIKSVSSSKKGVITIDKTGKITATKCGSTTVTVKDTKNKSYQCKVTVTSKVSSQALTLNSGDSKTVSLKGSSIASATTSNKKIATVDSKGKITAKNAGTATVTLKDKQGTAHKVKVTVNAKLTTKTLELENGESKQIKLKGASLASVKSLRETVAVVDQKGNVTGVTRGSTKVEAVDSTGKKHTVTVKVTNTEVQLDTTNVTIGYGESVKLQLKGTKVESVSSSDEKIAFIRASLSITGVECGKTTVSVKGENGRVYYCHVTVVPVLEQTELTLDEGKTAKLTLLGGKIAATTSSNETVAVATNAGKVSGVAAGTATITVKDTAGRDYTCAVTVRKTATDSTSGSTSGGDTSGGNGSSSSEGDPDPEPPTPDTPDKPKNPCTITFVCVDTLDELTLPEARTYQKGDKIGTLAGASCAGYTFLGWYYDKKLEKPVSPTDTIEQDIPVYASMVANTTPADVQDPSVAEEGVSLDYTMQVQAASASDVEKYAELTSASNPDEALSFTAKKSGAYFNIVPASSYEKGNTYTLTIRNTDKVRIVFDGEVKGDECVEYTITTIPPEPVKEMGLNENIRYIDINRVKGLDSSEYQSGIVTADINGATENSFNGTFTYDGTPALAIGDTVSLYEGKRPDKRTLEDDQAGDAGKVVWVKITGVNGNRYSYSNAEADDILALSNVLPVTKAMDLDGNWGDNRLTIANKDLDFTSERYEESMLDGDSVLQVGDFVELSDNANDETAGRIGRITEISVDEATDTTVIQFRSSSREEFDSELNVYEEPEAHAYDNMSEEQRQAFVEALEEDMLNSGIIEQSQIYLTALALDTDEFRAYAQEQGIEDPTLVMDDGSEVSVEDIQNGGDIVIMSGDDGYHVSFNITKTKIEFSGRLEKLRGVSGLHTGILFGSTITITPENAEHRDSGLTIDMTTAIATELGFGISVKCWRSLGWKVWTWKIGVDTSIDIANYVGIGVTATAVSKQPVGGDSTNINTIVGSLSSALNNINSNRGGTAIQFIDDVNKQMEALRGEGNLSGQQTLAEKYASMMQSDESKAVRIFEQRICKVPIPLACGMSGLVDLVIEVKLFVDVTVNISVGITFTYIRKQRYTVSISLGFSGISVNKSNKTLINQYEFQLFAMGHIGIYCGLEASVGLSALGGLAKLTLGVNLGPDINLYGFAYIRVSNVGKSGIWGAIYLSLDFVIKVWLYAKVGYKKLSASKTWNLLEKRYPIWSTGDKKIVTGYYYEGDDILIPDDIAVTEDKQTLPNSVYQLVEMDIKSGLMSGDTYGDEDEYTYPAIQKGCRDFKAEIIEVGDKQHFFYDQSTGTVTVKHDRSDKELEADLKLTYTGKMVPTYNITSSEQPFQTIHLVWKNRAGRMLVTVDSEGNGIEGAGYVHEATPLKITFDSSRNNINLDEDAETLVLGQPNNKAGYLFDGWQVGNVIVTEQNKQTTATIKEDITITPVWKERTSIPYRVNVYQQDILGYTPQDSYSLIGTRTEFGAPNKLATADIEEAQKLLADPSLFKLDEEKSTSTITVQVDESEEANLYFTCVPMKLTFRSISPVSLTPITIDVAKKLDNLWDVVPSNKEWLENGDYTLAYYTDVDNNIISPYGGDIVNENGDTVSSMSYDEYEVKRTMTLTAHWVKNTGVKLNIEVYLDDGNGGFARSEELSKSINGELGQSYQRTASGFGISLGKYDSQYTQIDRFEVKNEVAGDNDDTFQLREDGTTTVCVYYVGAGKVTLESNCADILSEDAVVMVGSGLLNAFPYTDRRTDSTHYQLAGVYRDAEHSQPVTESDVMLNGDDVTLYADWQPVYTTLTVKYYTEGIFGIPVLSRTEEKRVLSGVKEFTAQDGSVCNLFTLFASDEFGELKYVSYNNVKDTVLNKSFVLSPEETESKTLSYYYRKKSFIVNWHNGGSVTTAETAAGANLLYNAPSVKLDGSTLLGWTDKATLEQWQNDWTTYDESKLLNKDAICTENADYYAVLHDNRYMVNVEFYLERVDGTDFERSADLTEQVMATLGKSVTTDIKTLTGFVFDEGNAHNLVSAIATPSTTLKLYYKRALQTVTWVADSVTVQQKQYPYGAAITENDMPILSNRVGYEVNGWQNQSEVVGSAVLKDRTITADITPVKVAVTYDTAGGTITKAGVTEITYDTAFGTLPIAERKGYIFLGWFTEVREGTPVTESTITHETEATTIYAHWEEKPASTVSYTVKHFLQDAESGAYTERTEDEDTFTAIVGEESAAVAKGYPHYNAKPIVQLPVAEDGSTVIKVYYDLQTYTLTANANNGDSKPQTLTLRYGQSVDNKLTRPIRTGYDFTEWLVDSCDFDGNMTISAVWTARTDTIYTVKHYAQKLDGKFYEVTADRETLTGTTDTQTNALVKEYAHYAKPEVVQKNIEPDGSTVIELEYALDKHSLTFVSDGETVASSVEFYGTPVTEHPISKTGYTFNGWLYNGKAVDFSTFTVEGDTTLTASWTINQYQVTYSTANKVETVTYHEYASGSTAPDKYGYTLTGWSTTEGGTTPFSFNTTPITADVTLYPIYTLNTVALTVNQYLMDTEGNYPSTPTSTQIVNRDALSKVALSDYIDAQYITEGATAFRGAKLNDSNAYEKTAVTLAGETVQTLNLFYDRSQYKVTWNVDGKTTSETLYSGASFTKPADPTKVGYTFTGWDALGDVTTVGTADVTYTATWQVNTYTVTLNTNGGSINSGDVTQYTYGIGATLPTDVTRVGYTFAGWYDNAELEGNAVTTIAKNRVDNRTYWAKWTVNPYKVTLNTNGGDAIAAIDFTVESDTIALPNATRKGYTFAGWYDNAELEGDAVTTVAKNSTENRAYWAKWKINTYLITLKLDGGAFAEDVTAPSQFNIKSETITLPEPAKRGYTFAGWYDGDTKVAEIATGSTENRTYTAKWTVNTYTATLNSNGGDAIEPIDFTVESEPITLPNATRKGYTFAGWQDKDGKSVTEIVAGSIENRTYTAQWTVNTYTITLHTNEGTINRGAVTEYTYGVGATLPTDVTRENYNFAGWYDNEALTGVAVTSISENEIENQTFWAKWVDKDKFAVLFDTQGGSAVEQQLIQDGKLATAPADPTKAGYTFGGWRNGDSEWNFSTVITEPVTLIAKWNVVTYTVAFDTAGGAFAENATIPTDFTVESETIALPNATRTGYTFAGWQDKDDNTVTEIVAGSTENRTYTAKWTVNSYTATLNSNGGDAMDAIVFTIESKSISLPDATRKGYTFAGWQDKDGNAVAEIATGSTENRTYTAQWTVNSYTATLNTNGGDAIAPIDFTVESEAITLPNATRNGYTFAGWQDKDGNAVAEIVAGSTENRTYTAQWTVNSYTATLNSNGGDAIAPISFTIESETIALPDATCNGYTFTGWKDKDGKSVTEIVAGSTENRTYTAQWTVNTYTVTLNTNGGNAIAPISFTVESETFTLPEPTKTGYHFLGWFTDEAFTEDSKMTAVESGTYGDITLYAKWEINTYTVTYKDGSTTVHTEQVNHFDAVQENTTAVGKLDTVKGEHFKQWNTTDGNLYDLNTPLTDDLTLTAKREINDVTLNVEHYIMDTAGNYQLDETLNESRAVKADSIHTADAYKLVTYTADGFAFGKAEYDGVELPSTAEAVNLKDETDNTTHTLKLYYKRNQYTVTWKPENGEESAVQTLYFGATITAPSTAPTKTGYDFKGWDNFTAGATVPAENVSYTAQWSLHTYSVTLNLNEGTLNESAAVTGYDYEHETALPTAENITRTGYTFKGWCETADCSDEPTDKILKNTTGDKTFYAKWTANVYSVTLNLNDDDARSSANINTGNVTEYTYATGATLPTDVTRNGYTFKGWYDNEALSGEAVTELTTTDIDAKTFWAKWEVNPITLTVNHYIVKTDGVTYPDATDIVTTATPNAWADINITDYVKSDLLVTNGIELEGGKLNGDDNYAVDNKATLSWENNQTLNLYYKRIENAVIWKTESEPDHTLTTVHTDNVYYGAQFNVASDPTRTGHTFVQWLDKDSNTFAAIAMPNEAVTYTAEWTTDEYALTFDDNAGGNTVTYDIPAPEHYTYEATVTLPTLTREGYDFLGWCEKDKDGNLTGEPLTEIAAHTLTDARSYFAKWDAQTYTIMLSAGKGKGKFVKNNKSTLVVTHVYDDAEIALPTNSTENDSSAYSVTRPYYTFTGWVDEDENPVTSIPSQFLDDIVYYATWQANPSQVKLHTADGVNEGTFSDGTPEFTIDTHYDEPVPLADYEKPTLIGYDFAGWYESPTLVEGETEVTNAKNNGSKGEIYNLYAHWTLHHYKLTFKLGDGSITEAPEDWTEGDAKGEWNTTFTYAGGYTLPSPNTVQRYTDSNNQMWLFDGWYSDANYQTPIESIITTNHDMTIYAKWVKGYTVKFDMNGGIDNLKGDLGNNDVGLIPTELVFKEGEPINAIDNIPVKSVEHFLGWYVADENGNPTGEPWVFVGTGNYLGKGTTSLPNEIPSDGKTPSTVTQNMTLKAKWAAWYKVEFEVPADACDKQKSDTVHSTHITKTGSGFDPNGNEKAALDEDGYEQLDINAQEVKAGQLASYPMAVGATETQAKPTRDNYDFVGWFVVDADGNTTSTKWDFATSKVTKDTKLRAVMKGRTYQLTVNTNVTNSSDAYKTTVTMADSNRYNGTSTHTTTTDDYSKFVLNYIYDSDKPLALPKVTNKSFDFVRWYKLENDTKTTVTEIPAGATSAEYSIEWRSSTPLSKLTKPGNTITISKSGDYYVDEDMTADLIIQNNVTVGLCLNDHSLTGSGTTSVIKVESGSTLKLYNCSGSHATYDKNAHQDKGSDATQPTNGIITGGKATNGGGIYNKGSLCIYGNIKICDNTASLHGGGVFNVYIGTFTMNGGTISNNTADSCGGGIYNEGTVTMNGGTISNNTANNCGGGIYNNEGTVTMNGGTISNNTAPYGSGGGIYSYGTVTMNSGTISGNTATDGGGGVYNTCILEMSGGTISNNKATDGGGIYSYGTVTMNSGTISGNTATNGGGIYNRDTVTMKGGTISGNKASNGGGVYNNGTVTMNSGTISDNNAFNRGGGVYNTGTLEMSGGTISGNTAKYDGGGMCNYGTLEMSGGIISGNKASNGGGVSNDGTVTMNSGTISNNTATFYGGGVYNRGGKFTLSGSASISNNNAIYGGGVYNTSNATYTKSGGSINGNTATSNKGANIYPAS